MPPRITATPEDLFGHIEPAPPSFLLPTLPSTPQEQPQDELTLDYISRMLMEEDNYDESYYQYPDHPMLLQVEQPFAQILSASSTISSLAPQLSTPSMASPEAPCQSSTTHTQSPAFFVDTLPNNSLSPSNNMHMLSTMAFFEGMEEANRFLPTKDGMVEGKGRKNRLHKDGDTEAGAGRSSKKVAVLVQPADSEDESVREMLHSLMINGHKEPICTRKKEKGQEHQSISIYRKTPRRRGGARQAVVPDLETLLIRCADAVAINDSRSAVELLERIKRHSSPWGNATQRVAHYFAEGLEARLAGHGSQLYHSLMEKRISVVDCLKAYNLFMATSCFLKVPFLFTNKTIYNAVAGKKKLHIVHYSLNDGLQWPELFQLLADREGGPPEVRITGISSITQGFRPAQEIEEAGRQLNRCATHFGVPFKFQAVVAKPAEAVHVEDLDINPDEVLAVYSLLHFENLMDESLGLNKLSPRDLVLNTIREMKPSVFVQIVSSGSYGAALFMTRFRQALFSFRAKFDMMENIMPQDSDERLLLERDIFAPSAINIIACEGADRVERPQNYREWQVRNQRAGLRQLPLDPEIVEMLIGEVKRKYHEHFVISEDHRWLVLGWKGQVLYALSAWTADDDSNSDSV